MILSISRGIKWVAKRTMRETHYSYLRWHKNVSGWLPAFRRYAGFLWMGGAIEEMHLPGSSHHRIWLRPGTPDQSVFSKVFLGREYELDLGSPGLIVDAGAHIGLSAIFFARRYPRATVVAIEPDAENFELLCRNVEPFPHVRPLHAALWSEHVPLTVCKSRRGNDASEVARQGPGVAVPAVTVEDVLAQFQPAAIDVLKLDVEGAEREILSASASWIDRVGAIVIELHDRFHPGCQAALDEAIRDRGFSRTTVGENVVIRRSVGVA